MRKLVLPFAGVCAAVLVDLLVHYIAAATENLPFIQQFFSPLGIVILVILVLAGLAIGVVIEVAREKSKQPSSSSPPSQNLTGASVKQRITARGGGEVDKSPQRVKGHVVGEKINQGISAINKGKIKDSGQSIDIT